MKYLLSEAQKDSYFQKGFLIIENLICKDDIRRLQLQSELIGDNKIDHVPISSTQVEPEVNVESPIEKNLTLRKLYDIAIYDQIFWNHDQQLLLLIHYSDYKTVIVYSLLSTHHMHKLIFHLIFLVL